MLQIMNNTTTKSKQANKSKAAQGSYHSSSPSSPSPSPSVLFLMVLVSRGIHDKSIGLTDLQTMIGTVQLQDLVPWHKWVCERVCGVVWIVFNATQCRQIDTINPFLGHAFTISCPHPPTPTHTHTLTHSFGLQLYSSPKKDTGQVLFFSTFQKQKQNTRTLLPCDPTLAACLHPCLLGFLEPASSPSNRPHPSRLRL